MRTGREGFRRVQKNGFSEVRRDRKYLEDEKETSRKQETNLFYRRQRLKPRFFFLNFIYALLYF